MLEEIRRDSIVIILLILPITVILLHAQTYYKRDVDIDLYSYGNSVKAIARDYHNNNRILSTAMEKDMRGSYLSYLPKFSYTSDLYVSLHRDSGKYAIHLNAEHFEAQPYSWLKENKYFIYKLFFAKSYYLLKIEILKVYDNKAYLKLTILNYSDSCLVTVNLETREVFMNEEKIGYTLMFFKMYPKSGEEYMTVVFNRSIKRIKVKIIVRGFYDTPRGSQKVYLVKDASGVFFLLYDYDTGVLLSGFTIGVEEAFIKAFKVKYGELAPMWVYYLSMVHTYELYDTNADLGPIDIFYEIRKYFVRNFPLILLLFSLILSLIIIYRRKARRL